MNMLPYLNGAAGPTVIDAAFEQEARSMKLAMDTGELPPEGVPYYQRVKKLAEMHWAAKASRQGGRQ